MEIKPTSQSYETVAKKFKIWLDAYEIFKDVSPKQLYKISRGDHWFLAIPYRYTIPSICFTAIATSYSSVIKFLIVQTGFRVIVPKTGRVSYTYAGLRNFEIIPILKRRELALYIDAVWKHPLFNAILNGDKKKVIMED
jgi:hypothetical protein